MPSTPSYMFGRTSSFSAATNGASTPAALPIPPGPSSSSPASNFFVPQAMSTSYSARVKTFNTSLIVPTPQQTSSVLPPRSSKRGLAVINYAEDDDDDFEDRSDPRYGGRGVLDFNEDNEGRPIEVKGRLAQGIRPSFFRTDEQHYEASLLPCTLVPIRLDIDLNPQTRLKDSFLWNLYESLITPDQFAQILCQDLDLQGSHYVGTISAAIRTQLEEYAPIASITLPDSIGGDDEEPSYRVIVKISLYVGKYLYEDKFEWDMLNRNLTPEHFAKISCRDMGLGGEFLPLITNAIYEQVLKLKKELLETGQVHLLNENIDNDAAPGSTGRRGWRHDPDGLGVEWGPAVEQLTREEIEKREGDRERQIRRVRRETSRFTAGSNLAANFLFMDMGTPGTPGRGSATEAEEPLGRGERKKRKRNRSGSPSSALKPKHHGAVASSALGPLGAVQLSEYERSSWRCIHCQLPGTGTWAVREGPAGPKTLCNICGALWKQDDMKLPAWRLNMYKYEYWGSNRS